MEIYKLKDEAPKKARHQQTESADGNVEDGVVSGELKVTDLKAGVKNPHRVNVFVNSHFICSLDVTQVVDLKVKVGRVLSRAELEELRKASDFGKSYQRALEWVLVRPRSKKEVRDYLLRRKIKRSPSDNFAPIHHYERRSTLAAPVDTKQSSEDFFDFTDEIITLLTTKGYVDDRRFAEFWVENRFVKKGVSKKRLAMELRNKGVAQEIVDEVLGGRDEEEEIKKIIARKQSKYDDDKLIQYLCRQGFPYDLVERLVKGD